MISYHDLVKPTIIYLKYNLQVGSYLSCVDPCLLFALRHAILVTLAFFTFSLGILPTCSGIGSLFDPIRHLLQVFSPAWETSSWELCFSLPVKRLSSFRQPQLQYGLESNVKYDVPPDP